MRNWGASVGLTKERCRTTETQKALGKKLLQRPEVKAGLRRSGGGTALLDELLKAQLR